METDEDALERWLLALDKSIQYALRQRMNIALGLGQSLCPTLRLLWPRTLVDSQVPLNPAIRHESKFLSSFDTRTYIQRTTAQIPSQCVLIANDVLFFRSLTSTTIVGENIAMADVAAQCMERITALLQVSRVRIRIMDRVQACFDFAITLP